MKDTHKYHPGDMNSISSSHEHEKQTLEAAVNKEHMRHGKNDAQARMGMRGHDHHAMMIADFKKRFYVVLLLTVPVMLLSMQIQQWLRLELHFTGSNYLLFGLSTVVFVYGGWPFLTGWLSELKAKSPGMMTLIGFAITVAYIYSAATVFGLKGMDFFGN